MTNKEQVFNEELANIIAEVVGHEMKMEEEVEMKKVSILDRFAAHHNRAEKVEVVVEENKEEEIEMKKTIEEEVAKIVDELERQSKVNEDNEVFERMVKREEKKERVKAKLSCLFGIAKQTALVAKDKVASTVDSKVEDFLFGSLDKESSAPVEKGEEEVKVAADDVVKEVDGLRAELKREATRNEKLKEINQMRQEIRLEMQLAQDVREQTESKKELDETDRLKEEIEALKAQVAFEESKQQALLAGVKESDILNTKEDIDAYFMGQ